jgi:hypothetical protein
LVALKVEQEMNYQQISEQSVIKSKLSKNSNTAPFRDFRDYTVPNHNSSDYITKGLDYRFYEKGVDKLNRSTGSLNLTNQNPYDNPGENSDIIKFGFECMSNDTLGSSVPLIFRAFLTNGISDNHSAELNGFKYMGRGETFYTYQGFQRSISFGFKIASFSKDEMTPLYNKLNYLASQVYPDYSDAGFMRAPLVKVTIGDYLYRVPGFLESVNITVDNNAPWELDSYELPKVLDVSVSFKPIHDVLPSRVKNVNGKNTGVALIGNGPTGPIQLYQPNTQNSVPTRFLSTEQINNRVLGTPNFKTS